MKRLKKVYMEVIPSKEQLYPTVGNYWTKGNNVDFRISNLKNMDMELLVFIHELI